MEPLCKDPPVHRIAQIENDTLAVSTICMLYAGVKIGFNDSILVTTEGQSEPAIVCIQVTSGVLQRNVSVYLDTINNTDGGRLFT